MEGLILIEDYKIHCLIGVYGPERQKEIELLLDISLKTDMAKCVESDAIMDTVDYERVGNACRLLAEKKEFRLLETFAFEALETLFEQFPAVRWAKIRVKKRVPFARYSAVELEKARE